MIVSFRFWFWHAKCSRPFIALHSAFGEFSNFVRRKAVKTRRISFMTKQVIYFVIYACRMCLYGSRNRSRSTCTSRNSKWSVEHGLPLAQSRNKNVMIRARHYMFFIRLICAGMMSAPLHGTSFYARIYFEICSAKRMEWKPCERGLCFALVPRDF